MILNWFWAQNPAEVSQVVFDFFSFAHVCMGIVFFAAISLISTLRNFVDPNNFKVKMGHWIWFFVGTLIFAIVWEIIENTLLFELGWKYQNQQEKCEFPWYYLFDSLSFILFFVIYLALEF
jgi:hypothetical protein